jgi:hypothetical protein
MALLHQFLTANRVELIDRCRAMRWRAQRQLTPRRGVSREAVTELVLTGALEG